LAVVSKGARGWAYGPATDVHTHLIPAELAAPGAFAAGWPFDPAMLANMRECVELDGILRGLDAIGADRAVISPQVNLLADNLPPGLAERSVELHLERFSTHVSGASNRLRAFGTVAMQTPAIAVRQLELVMATPGFVGVEVAATIGGKFLGDGFDEFWEAAEALGSWVFVHPTMTALDLPALAPIGLANSLGNPIETALSAATLVTSGALERFPNLRVLLAHGGGALLALRGRLGRAQHVFTELERSLRDPISVSLRRLYFDSLVYDTDVLEDLITWVGDDHIFLASDYPFAMGLADPVSSVTETMIADDAKLRILSGNAASFFDH